MGNPLKRGMEAEEDAGNKRILLDTELAQDVATAAAQLDQLTLEEPDHTGPTHAPVRFSGLQGDVELTGFSSDEEEEPIGSKRPYRGPTDAQMNPKLFKRRLAEARRTEEGGREGELAQPTPGRLDPAAWRQRRMAEMARLAPRCNNTSLFPPTRPAADDDDQGPPVGRHLVI